MKIHWGSVAITHLKRACELLHLSHPKVEVTKTKSKNDMDNNTNKQKKAFIIAQSPVESTCRDILSKTEDSTTTRSHPSCNQRTTRVLYNNYTASKHMDAKNVPIFFVHTDCLTNEL